MKRYISPNRVGSWPDRSSLKAPNELNRSRLFRHIFVLDVVLCLLAGCGGMNDSDRALLMKTLQDAEAARAEAAKANAALAQALAALQAAQARQQAVEKALAEERNAGRKAE
jgi:hypothetical protein